MAAMVGACAAQATAMQYMIGQANMPGGSMQISVLQRVKGSTHPPLNLACGCGCVRAMPPVQCGRLQALGKGQGPLAQQQEAPVASL